MQDIHYKGELFSAAESNARSVSVRQAFMGVYGESEHTEPAQTFTTEKVAQMFRSGQLTNAHFNGVSDTGREVLMRALNNTDAKPGVFRRVLRAFSF